MKKNNQGFSLVELIVVVLIMAIIAVTLAPQVMKWVENSRKASDIQTRNTLKEQCEFALTDVDAFQTVKDGGYSITITKVGSNTPTFDFKEEGVSVTPNITNDYWKNLLKVCGCADFNEFKDKFQIKSESSSGSVVLTVSIYEDGFTIASLTGIDGNDDIEIVSDPIPEGRDFG